MANSIISIIVSVYSTEKYLHNCLDSILAQTFTDYELLLIDDGSTDKSGIICDEYASLDSRIRVFHCENRGSAAARQFGFERANGKYIVAIDSDDWVDENYLKYMFSLMEKERADMVMCAYWINENTYVANEPSQNNIRAWQKDMLSGHCHAGLWNKMFKRELLLSKDMLIPQYNYYEDMVVSLSYSHLCSHVAYSSNATYHYRQNPNSLTNNKDFTKRIQMYEECMRNMETVCEKYKYLSDSELRDVLYGLANYEKGRLLPFVKQGENICAILKKYFPESPSIIKVTSLELWGVKNAFNGHFVIYWIIQKTKLQKIFSKKIISKILFIKR